LCGGHAPPAARARALPGTLGIPEARGDGAACPRANQPAHIGGARHRAGGVAVNNGPAVAKLDADESADTGRAVDGPGRITVKDRRREPVAVVIANQAPGILSDTGYVAARIASTDGGVAEHVSDEPAHSISRRQCGGHISGRIARSDACRVVPSHEA